MSWAIIIINKHPTKFSHKKGRFMYSYLSSKNNPMISTWVINAPIKTADPLTFLKKNAKKKIPKILP